MTGKMTWRIVRFALLSAVLATGAVAGEAIPLYGTAEIFLTANNTYNGDAGEPNPFDLNVTAQIVSPSGRRLTAAGFFDGGARGAALVLRR